jgi:RNA polymerase sigma-70 factor (sigma-E family)
MTPHRVNDAGGGVTFEEYVRMRGPALVRLARLLTRDSQLAEDLVQDVLGRAYLHWDKILRTDRPDVYLRRMLINANVSRWRRRASHEVVGVVPDERPVAGGHDVDLAERDALWRLITKLPSKQQATVVLRYYEDLSDAAIAEILDCSPVTVRTHAMRALATLRERLGEQIDVVALRSTP